MGGAARSVSRTLSPRPPPSEKWESVQGKRKGNGRLGTVRESFHIILLAQQPNTTWDLIEERGI